MLRVLFLVCALALSMNVKAHRGAETLIDPPAVAVPQDLPIKDVERGIIAAAMKREWTVVDRKPGVVTFRYEQERKFSVTIAVSYDAHSIAIAYQDSSGLEFGEVKGRKVIHPSYRKWTRALAEDIGQRLNHLPPI